MLHLRLCDPSTDYRYYEVEDVVRTNPLYEFNEELVRNTVNTTFLEETQRLKLKS